MYPARQAPAPSAWPAWTARAAHRRTLRRRSPGAGCPQGPGPPAPWRRQARSAANLKTCAVPGRAVPASGRWLGTDPRIPGEAGSASMAAAGQQRGARAIFSCMGHGAVPQLAHSPPAAAHSPGLCLEQARPRAGNTAVPCRTRSRGHREAARTLAASGNPGASNAQAAFAASPQGHSLKPTLARWPRPREQAGHPTRQPGVSPGPICRAAVHSRERDWCPGWPNPRCSRYPAAHRCSWRWEKMSI
jgi:hypothetical protein